jgi:hypothetical protein
MEWYLLMVIIRVELKRRPARQNYVRSILSWKCSMEKMVERFMQIYLKAF